MGFRLRFLAHLLVILVILTRNTAIVGQAAPANNEAVSPTDPEGIFQELAPDTIPLTDIKPKPANRARAIRLLLAIKHNETGWNRQKAIYLLAMLGYDYERNRDELLKVWHGCVVKEDGTECDFMTALALIGLYEHGHKELLRPLLAGCRNSDGALSEALFPFYAEQLERNPRDFLAALASFPRKEQQSICKYAAWEYDDGPDPETLRKVFNRLMKIGGGVADRCARSYKESGQAAEDANRDNPVDPPK